jgi:hypothetical protein
LQNEDRLHVQACRRIFFGLAATATQKELSMSETILIGQGRQITTMPRSQWEEQLSRVPQSMKIRLSFMTRQHHLVRYFVVRHLPRFGKPIPPEYISAKLDMPLDTVTTILTELEQKLFFLVRDRRGHVSWAFPVTADRTRHLLRFDTGEKTYAA